MFKQSLASLALLALRASCSEERRDEAEAPTPTTAPFYLPYYDEESWSLVRGSILGVNSTASETTYTIFCPEQTPPACDISLEFPFVVIEGPDTVHFHGTYTSTYIANLGCELAGKTAATCSGYSSYKEGYSNAFHTGPTEIYWTTTLSSSEVEWGVLTLTDTPTSTREELGATATNGLVFPDPTEEGSSGHVQPRGLWAIIARNQRMRLLGPVKEKEYALNHKICADDGQNLQRCVIENLLRREQRQPAWPQEETAVTGAAILAPKDLDIKSEYSIRNVAATIAHDTMTYYKGNVSTNPIDTGDLQDPYYWWVAGSLWGAMLDYYHYTSDPTYNDVVIEALLAPTNTGPNFDYVPQEHAHEEGNDDLFFWGTAVISAAERNFPQPNESIPSWLDIGANVFNSLASRWNTTHCGGGLLWQIYDFNPNGLDYKNSISNGGFFQIAARMARATGNDTYLDWAEKIFDWSWDTGLIDNNYWHVYDGAHASKECKDTNPQSYTYTSGVYMYGAAVLANYTGDAKWAERAEKLLEGSAWFFRGDEESKNIMYEGGCETVDKCSVDMTTHKGQLARFMWQSTVMMPSLRPKIEEYLHASAKGAAASCSGGENGYQCGVKWFTKEFDGKTGLGQQMSALETIQGLLIHGAPAPLAGKDIQTVRKTDWEPVNPYRDAPKPKDGARSISAPGRRMRRRSV
ncbi:Mannan endo-1,6-alpha-mannosidase DCW1 [Paramyrothecium foliicola]|nr:Mannan endo-1,6-alpha-mannosidase DCW1 [Paramyrothecium foliicola]